jgi:hypothetical protein
METFNEARDTIYDQLISDDAEVRAEYMNYFEIEVAKFSDSMAQAFMKWRSLDNMVDGDDKRAYVSSQVFTANTLHILSMKLF